MKMTRILAIFLAIGGLCGSFACTHGSPNDEAEIVAQLEKSGKVEAADSTAASLNAAVPEDNPFGDGDVPNPRPAVADDAFALKSPASVPEIPAAAANPPPAAPPVEQEGTAKQTRPCKDGSLNGCSEDTLVGNQILVPYAVDSISVATVPYTPKFDTVTINPDFIDRVSAMTIGQYCEDKFNECTQGTTGPAGVSACSGAFNYCMDLGNCAPRREVCDLNHRSDCFHDSEVCFLEDLCRKKKVACVTDTQAPTECEGERMACNSKIEGRLSDCVSTKDRCLKEGGGSQECYWDYESCKKSLPR